MRVIADEPASLIWIKLQKHGTYALLTARSFVTLSDNNQECVETVGEPLVYLSGYELYAKMKTITTKSSMYCTWQTEYPIWKSFALHETTASQMHITNTMFNEVLDLPKIRLHIRKSHQERDELEKKRSLILDERERQITQYIDSLSALKVRRPLLPSLSLLSLRLFIAGT